MSIADWEKWVKYAVRFGGHLLLDLPTLDRQTALTATLFS